MKTGFIYQTLRRELTSVEVENGQVHGCLKLTTQAHKHVKEAIELEIASSDIVEQGRTTNISTISPNEQIVSITLLPRISADLSAYYVAESAEPFYRQFSRMFVIPNDLMIYELAATDNSKLDSLKLHLQYAVAVRKSLDIIKDYKNDLNYCEEFFIHSAEPLIVQTFYQFNGEAQIGKVEEVLSFIESDPQKEVYKSFYKIQVIAFLRNVAEKDRFKQLLENFSTIFLNFKNSVELYFKNFDYEKNKNELEAKKIDLAKKIHSVVNDISTKAISIPAAYILILKDIDNTSPFKFLNLIYFFAAIVYALIIQTSFSNQWYFLKTLKADKQEFLMKSFESPQLVSLFGRYRTELNASCKLQSQILTFLTILLWLLPLTIGAIILYHHF